MSAMTFLADDLLHALTLGSLTARHTRNGDPDDLPAARHVHLVQPVGSTRLRVCSARGDEFSMAAARSWPPVPPIVDAPTLAPVALHVFETAALIARLRPLGPLGARVILAVQDGQLTLHDAAAADHPLAVARSYAHEHQAPAIPCAPEPRGTPAPEVVTVPAGVLADLAGSTASRTPVSFTGTPGQPGLLTWTCGPDAHGRLRMPTP